MAKASTLKNMLVCLTLVCLICSAVLAVVYALTKDPIDAAQVAKTNSSIAKVLPEFTSSPVETRCDFNGVEYTYYRAEGAGYAIISVVSGFGGPLSVMVGIDENGNVHNTAVLSHTETPGLGAKCQSDEGFLSQFRGWNPSEKKLVVRKDGGDVDAITASTITSRAYTLAIANAVALFNSLNEGGETNE